VDPETVSGGNLNLYLVTEIDKHDFCTGRAAKTLCYRCAGGRVQANPLKEAAWYSKKRDLPDSSKPHRQLIPHYENRLVRYGKYWPAYSPGGQRIADDTGIGCCDGLYGRRYDGESGQGNCTRQ